MQAAVRRWYADMVDTNGVLRQTLEAPIIDKAVLTPGLPSHSRCSHLIRNRYSDWVARAENVTRSSSDSAR